MKRVKIIVAYDGTNYCGWQIQPNGLSVQEVLEKHLSELLKEEIHIVGASRTDAGVHALGNVAAFNTNARMPADKISFAMNTRLPADIRIVGSQEVPMEFHPRFAHTIKTYEYKIFNRRFPDPTKRLYSFFYYYPLDVEKMRQAAAYLVGEHDFKSFCTAKPEVENTVRTVYSLDIFKEDDLITLRIRGNGFLYNMVRIIAGTLIRVGGGFIQPEEIKEILEAKDRSLSGETARPEGLTLVKIEYPEEEKKENDMEKSRIILQWMETLKTFGEEQEFPEEAREELQQKLREVGENQRLYRLFRSYEEQYEKNPSLDYQSMLKELETAGKEEGISYYTLHLLIFIIFSRKTWEYYQEKGISREIYHDSMADLRWKLFECRKMYGIWGSFVAFWFPWWFELKRFALGRMQYELIEFKDEYEKDGIRLTGDSKVVNVHIPSCGPLDPEKVKASYEKAAEFFKDEFPDGQVVFVCDSWLLFPAHDEMLPETSNIRKFKADYDVYKSREGNGDLWRIFYGAEEKGFENLPEDSGLMRAYKKWLCAGKMAGSGRGVHLLKIQ